MIKKELFFRNFNKDHNNFNDSNTKLKVDKSVNIFKENSLENVNNFDKLKNILDIRSNDIQQRLSLIIEKNIKLNNNKFEIQLRPENLGKIQITLEITGQNVDININSDNISTIQSLTENNNSLQKMLQSQGMNLNNFNFNGNNNKDKNKNFQSLDKINNEDNSVNTEGGIKEEYSLEKDKLVYVKA